MGSLHHGKGPSWLGLLSCWIVVWFRISSMLLLLLLLLWHAQAAESYQSQSQSQYQPEIVASHPNAQVESQANSSVLQLTFPVDNTTSSNITEESVRVCLISGMMPLTSNSTVQPYSLDYHAAALLAIQHLNRRQDTLIPHLSTKLQSCNLQFAYEFLDSQYSPIVASGLVVEKLLTRTHTSVETARPCAILGEVRSAVTATMSTLAGVNALPTISAASTSAFLDNKAIYPLLARTVPDDTCLASAAASYLYHVLNVEYCGVLFVRDEYGSAISSQFARTAYRLGMKHVQLQSFDKDGTRSSIQHALQKLKQTQYHYFFMVVLDVHYNTVMKEAVLAQVAGPGYFWLKAGELGGDKRFHKTLDQDVLKGTHGLADISVYVGVNERFDDEWRRIKDDPAWMEQFLSKMPPSLNNITTKTFQLTPTPSLYEYLHYDAILSLGLAACHPSTPSPFFTGLDLFQTLRNQTSFVGVTGLVELDPDTATRRHNQLPYRVRNILIEEYTDGGSHASSSGNQSGGEGGDGSMTTVGYQAIPEAYAILQPGSLSPHIHGPTHHLTQNNNHNHAANTPNNNNNNKNQTIPSPWEIRHPHIYSTNTTVPPPQLPPLTHNHLYIPSPILILGLTLAALSMSSALYWSIWSYLFRHTLVVKYSGVLFLWLLCVGAFLIASSVVAWGLQDNHTTQREGWVLDGACMAGPWLFQLGFVASYSALISKSALANRLFQGRRGLHRSKLHTTQILIPFFAFLLLTLLLLTLWTILGPMTWVRTNTLSVDMWERHTYSYGRCSAGNPVSKLFIILLAVLDVTVMVLAALESYRGRNVPSMYNEGRYIAISVAAVLQALLIGIPVLCAVYRNPTLSFVAEVLLTVVISTMVLFPVFLPKELARRRDGRMVEGVLEDSSSSNGSKKKGRRARRKEERRRMMRMGEGERKEVAVTEPVHFSEHGMERVHVTEQAPFSLLQREDEANGQRRTPTNVENWGESVIYYKEDSLPSVDNDSCDEGIPWSPGLDDLAL